MATSSTTLFATQLARHPSLRRVPLETMYARHPAQVDSAGKRFVPAVHRGPADTSLFLYPFSRYAYQDRILADGCTIEYHPSTNARVNEQLRALVGREVTLYAQVGRREAREARVVIEHPAGLGDDVFHLRLVPGSLPDAGPPVVPAKKVMWADMMDD